MAHGAWRRALFIYIYGTRTIRGAGRRGPRGGESHTVCVGNANARRARRTRSSPISDLWPVPLLRVLRVSCALWRPPQCTGRTDVSVYTACRLQTRVFPGFLSRTSERDLVGPGVLVVAEHGEVVVTSADRQQRARWVEAEARDLPDPRAPEVGVGLDRASSAVKGGIRLLRLSHGHAVAWWRDGVVVWWCDGVVSRVTWDLRRETLRRHNCGAPSSVDM